jgi:hypothetical protein
MTFDDPFKATVRVTEDPQRLRLGDVLRYDGVEQIVSYVNDSRAMLVPLQSNSVKYQTLLGKEVEFTTQGKGCNISPVYFGEILERRGEKGLRDWVDGNKKDSPRGHQLLNHKVRDVALAMGYYQWKFEDAKKALKAAGFELADGTIHRRLRRGKKVTPTITEEELRTLLPDAPVEDDPWKKVKVATKQGERAPTKFEKEVLVECVKKSRKASDLATSPAVQAAKKPLKDKKKVRRK